MHNLQTCWREQKKSSWICQAMCSAVTWLTHNHCVNPEPPVDLFYCPLCCWTFFYSMPHLICTLLQPRTLANNNPLFPFVISVAAERSSALDSSSGVVRMWIQMPACRSPFCFLCCRTVLSMPHLICTHLNQGYFQCSINANCFLFL